MKRLLVIIGVVQPLVLVPAAGPAQAGTVAEMLDRISNWGRPRALEADREHVTRALDSAVETPGRTISWRNPASGNNGTWTVTGSFENSDGYRCRNYRRTMTVAQTSTRYKGIVCKQVFFGWRVWSEEAVATQTTRATPRAPKRATPSDRAAKLGARLAAQPERDEVMESQKLLKQVGYDPGPIDGLYGKNTRAAIERFQRENDLATDGRVSASLIAALQESRKFASLPANPELPREPEISREAEPPGEPEISREAEPPGEPEISSEPEPPGAPAIPDARLGRGLAAYEQGDYQAAMQALRPLAEEGDPQAQFHVGMMHSIGLGVPTDHDAGTKWLKLAAAQGHTESQYSLGITYLKGIVVAQNYGEAQKWFRQAAERGEVNAQYELAQMYRHGIGVPQDDRQAAKWYQRAGEQGHAEAQGNLGSMYSEGAGVPQDDAVAVTWWRLAAEQGHLPSQRNLGLSYADGKGVPQDLVQAYAWLSLVASPRDPVAANSLARISVQLSPAEIETARRFAEARLAKSPETSGPAR